MDADGKLTLCAVEEGQFCRLLQELGLSVVDDEQFVKQLCIRLENDKGHIQLDKFLSVVEFGEVRKYIQLGKFLSFVEFVRCYIYVYQVS